MDGARGQGIRCAESDVVTYTPVVQPPDWIKEFHVFVDTSDIAIDSVLMQLT
mgnify:CR=1 FL=1